MLAARGQAEQYVRALPATEPNPPFLIVVDLGQTVASDPVDSVRQEGLHALFQRLDVLPVSARRGLVGGDQGRREDAGGLPVDGSPLFVTE